MTCQSEVGPLRRVLLRHPRDAFQSQSRIDDQWRDLGYRRAPNYDAACAEYDCFVALFARLDVQIEWLVGDDLGLDSLYARDASLVTDRGVIPCAMGKGARRLEPGAHHRFLAGLLPIAGTMADVGTLEGGDVAWLDSRTLAVGRGYRTNEAAIEHLAGLLPDVDILRVPLPHWRGPADVFHLMSILSPLDENLLLVYSPLMSVPFREDLLARGFELVEVPDDEFDSQGCNVLAVSPRVAIALDGNPETRRRMEAAGVEVYSYAGSEISLPGCGGPTCLTRPLERD